MMIKIREIKIDDFVKFNALYKQIENESDYMLYVKGERQTTDEQQKMMLERIVANPYSTLFVAEEQNNLVGFIGVLSESPSKRKYMRYVAMGILEKYQGKKIGAELMKECVNFCDRQEVKRIELTVVCENEKAVNLYKKFGFDIEGVKRCSLYMNDKFYDEFYMSRIR